MRELEVLDGGAEELMWQERALCAQTDPGGLLPGEGWVDAGGEASVPVLRRSGRLPRVRPDER